MLGSHCVSLGVYVCVCGGMIVLPDRDDLISEQQAQRMSPRLERFFFFFLSFSERRREWAICFSQILPKSVHDSTKTHVWTLSHSSLCFCGFIFSQRHEFVREHAKSYAKNIFGLVMLGSVSALKTCTRWRSNPLSLGGVRLLEKPKNGTVSFLKVVSPAGQVDNFRWGCGVFFLFCFRSTFFDSGVWVD